MTHKPFTFALFATALTLTGCPDKNTAAESPEASAEPAAAAAEAKPAEDTQPADEAKPAEAAKPAEEKQDQGGGW